MAKIRIAQIKDLSLTDGVITIGSNSITPLTSTTIIPGENTVDTVITNISNNGGIITATTRNISDILNGYATQNWVTEQLGGYYTKTEIDGLLDDKLDESLLNSGALVASSTTTIPSEKTVADYVASQIAADVYTPGAGINIKNDHEISANFDLEIVNGQNGVTNLVIKDGETTIASVDASQFVIDGMLENATFSTETNDLTLTFKTAAEGGVTKQDIVIPLDSLVDVYTGNGVIDVSKAGVIYHKTSGVIAGTYGATADDSATTFGSSVTVKVPSLTVTAEGHVSEVEDKSVTVTLPSLPTTIGTAVQDVTGDTYVSATKTGTTVTLTTVIGDVADGEDKLATASSVKEYVDSKVQEEFEEVEISFEKSKLFRTTFSGQNCGSNMGLNATYWTIDQDSVCVYINGQLIPNNDVNYTISQNGDWTINVSRNQFDAEGSDFTVENTDRIDVVAHGTQYQTLNVLQFKRESES